MIWASLILMKYMNNLKTFAFTNRQRYTVFVEYRHTETQVFKPSLYRK